MYPCDFAVPEARTGTSLASSVAVVVTLFILVDLCDKVKCKMTDDLICVFEGYLV